MLQKYIPKILEKYPKNIYYIWKANNVYSLASKSMHPGNPFTWFKFSGIKKIQY